MSYPIRLLVVLLTFFLAPRVGAADKPSARPADARRAALVRAGYTPVPLALDPRRLSFFVDGAVGPEKVKFFLDSGFRETVLDLTLARRLKLELGADVAMTGMGGVLVGRRTYVPGLMIGPYDTLKDWHMVAAKAADLSGWPGAPGVLGMEVLDPWAAVVDLPARTMYLRPPLVTAWPRLAGTWAVTSWQEDGAARKIDSKNPPTFTFAENRLKLIEGGKTREYAIRFGPHDTGDYLLLSDPKRDGDPMFVGGGRIKVKDRAMTACLALEIDKLEHIPTSFAAPQGSGYVLLELKHLVPDARKQPDPLRELLLKDRYTAVPLDREPDGKRMAAARVGRHNLRLVVDTGTAFSTFDAGGLAKWGAERLGGTVAEAVGGEAKGEKARLRGLTLGGYDTRQAWSEVSGWGFDLTGINQLFAERKRQPVQGLLGNLDLLNGSAVIDFGTNTLYLRPIKETLWPQLEGKWVGVRYEFDGRKGPYAAGDGTVEFRDGRLRFTARNGTAEWGFHLRDEGDKYRVGLFDPKADELADGFKYSSTGLLKLSGDKITLLMEQGPVRKEPAEFAAPKGSGLLLVEYERAK
jgi:predicted aspartyl protease